MKIKTSELEGAALDWAVAVALGWSPTDPHEYGLPSYADTIWVTGDKVRPTVQGFRPSTDWSQGGPLLSEYATHAEKYPLAKHEPWVVWVANDEPGQCGDTLLIAAMRAIVAAELGDTVDVPEELLS